MSDLQYDNIVTGAISTVLGYIGAEAATPTAFTHLLWPQRAYAGLTWKHCWKLALLGPSGGPLYKGALQVLDECHASGLLRGPTQGQMLGTAFFPDGGSSYTIYVNGPNGETHTESARNCIWQRIMPSLPHKGNEKVIDSEKGVAKPRVARARVAVHHLTLATEKHSSSQSTTFSVDEECSGISTKTLVGIAVSESTAVAMALIVVVVWKSWFAILWLVPLLLEILSAFAALRRDPLMLDQDRSSTTLSSFELQSHSRDGFLLLITAPPSLVTQFFRHYGHPIRDRPREVLQIAIVVALAAHFPIGLLCSVAWMPVDLQRAWISYQLYSVLAMYIARYLDVTLWTSTERLVAQKLVAGDGRATLWSDPEAQLHVQAILTTTYHDRYGEAKAHLAEILRRTVDTNIELAIP